MYFVKLKMQFDNHLLLFNLFYSTKFCFGVVVHEVPGYTPG